MTPKPDVDAVVFNSDYDDDVPAPVRKSIRACDLIQKIVLPPSIDYHILNGEPVEVGEFPHQVGL